MDSNDDDTMMTSEEGTHLLVESLNGQIESLLKEVSSVKESHAHSEVKISRSAVMLLSSIVFSLNLLHTSSKLLLLGVLHFGGVGFI